MSAMIVRLGRESMVECNDYKVVIFVFRRNYDSDEDSAYTPPTKIPSTAVHTRLLVC